MWRKGISKLDLAMISWIGHQRHEQQKEKETNWTSSKLKASEDVKQKECLCTISGMQTCVATVENSRQGPQKLKIELTSNVTTRCLPKEEENTELERYTHLYLY